jgi:hypothetical protein
VKLTIRFHLAPTLKMAGATLSATIIPPRRGLEKRQLMIFSPSSFPSAMEAFSEVKFGEMRLTSAQQRM